ncbi:MAG TPA: hypothetical protein VN764_17200, partial [Polyangiaceae bacterium]|nr:hypothetical protein [Polyangiaceae bacterium]
VKTITRSLPSKKLKDRDAYRVRFSAEGQTPETIYLSQENERVLLIQPLQLGDLPAVSSPDARERKDKAWEEQALHHLHQLKKLSAQRKN